MRPAHPQLDSRYQFQWLNAEPPILNVGCESDPALLHMAPGTVNTDIDDWSGTTPAFQQMDACQPWPFLDGSFDTVVMSDCLDHMEDPAAALKEAARVARRALVITLPKDIPTPEGAGNHLEHVEDLKKIGLKACAPGDLHRRHAHYDHWTEDRVRALLSMFSSESIDLGSVCSGPLHDQHWYWAAVVRVCDTDARVAREPPTPELPKVSVLCGTYRPGGLDVLFRGLGAQDYHGEWELVLVDELYKRRRHRVEELHSQPQWSLLHVPVSRTLYPRDSTGRSHNEAIVQATGDIAIWLMDYAWVPPNWISAHVAEHLAYEAETGRRDLVVNGAFVNTWPPRLTPRCPSSIDPTDLEIISKFPLSIFAETPSPEFIRALPLTNRALGSDGLWSRSLHDVSQDGATMRVPEGWCGHGHYFMKNDSVRLDILRELGGNDESFDGLHKFHDTELAMRLAARGCRFIHSKRAVVRVLQVRHLMKRLGAPAETDAEAKGLALLDDTRARIAAGNLQPRETHPALRREP